MNSNCDEWTVRFNTLSRDGAIKACTILARAIDSARITEQKTKIFILGGAGKSLIMDAIARDISDHHTPYKMPPTRFVESKPSNALKGKVGRHIVKGIKHHDKSCVVTFCHLSGYHKKSWLEDLLSKHFQSRNVGVDFMTEINDGFNEAFIADISIDFYPDDNQEIENGWGREWRITIKNQDLKTNAMKQALEQLEQYNANRERRLLSKTSMPIP